MGIDTGLTAAGVAKMTFSSHFRSKEELIAAVLEQRRKEIAVALSERIAVAQASFGDPGALVLALFDWEGWPTGCAPPISTAACSSGRPASTPIPFRRSVKLGILQWIPTAKRPATRAKRIEATARQAAENGRANQWRRPKR